MSVTVNPPKTPVTEGSGGVAAATLPNVCKMPGPPAPFVPTPLPNIGKSDNGPKDYSKDVTIEGKKVAIKGATFKSMGDVASKGTGGGLISSNTEGPTSFVGPGSMDVKIEGKNVQLLGDPMLNNGGPSGTPANAGTMIGIIQATGLVTAVDDACPICHEHHGKLEETEASKADAAGLAAKFDVEVKAVSGTIQTMLGVVKCKCGRNYADQSGVTTIELCAAAAASGMKHAEGVTHTIADRSRKGRSKKSVADTTRRMQDLFRGSSIFTDAWRTAQDRVALSYRNLGLGPAAYPPGTCAAQKVLLLLGDDGALPGTMTERWYSSRELGTKSPIEFVDARGVAPETRVERFAHGATVPPCQTCEIIVPLLLCPGDKLECAHKS